MFSNKKKADEKAVNPSPATQQKVPAPAAAPAPAPAPKPEPAAPAQPQASQANNVIGKDIELVGNVETLSNLIVEGNIKGDVKAESTIAVGESSKIDGNIVAKSAVIAGNVTGTIEVADMLVLKATAVVDGDITTQKLMVEAGAAFNGACRMTGTAAASKPAASATDALMARANAPAPGQKAGAAD